jgi:hypothetical protein
MTSFRGAAIAALLLCVSAGTMPRALVAQEQNWTHYVRIGAYGLRSDNADAIVRDATKSHVFGIEVDNDIPGRYESFLDPQQKLVAIRGVAQKAHAVGNKAFVYIAGTECITANADKSPHSVVKDHPNWLQRKLTGEPAVFTSGAAFWIRKGDEDVWISPYAEPWRHTYMERVRQIAGTGIDGIYVDIPYWMTHFDGWEDSWASFDDFTVAAFRKQYGLDARKDLKLGDFSDPNFRKWITFRIDTLTNFVREIRENARSVNPAIMVIPEIYPGIEQEAVRVGSDVYEMYGVVDAIAHEYEFGDGDHMASGRPILDWFLYQAGMLTFRGFAEGKATWILNYSWDGDKGVAAPEAMKTLAASQIVDGANFWDAPGHSMGGSNDPATRAVIFDWISKHEKTFYLPRMPLKPIGIYFSPASRNFDASRFLSSYRGTVVLLLQNHIDFRVVTPRTLSGFRGDTLVLPDVSELSDSERGSLETILKNNGRLVVAGVEPPGLPASSRIVRFADSPGTAHLRALEKDFAAASQHMPTDFLSAIAPNQEIMVNASPFVASNMAQVNGQTHIFLANFAGIVPHLKVKPTADSSVRVSVHAPCNCELHFLPFLGEEQVVPSAADGDKLSFSLPVFDRAAVAWLVPEP